MFFQTHFRRNVELLQNLFCIFVQPQNHKPMSLSNQLGRDGEDLAVQFLLKNGYQILERNYRYRKAEIDIIALKNETLAVVEVKSRTSSYFGAPESFVSPKKIKLLVMATDHYVTSNNLSVTVRFDIISILKDKKVSNIQHIEDAFYFF